MTTMKESPSTTITFCSYQKSMYYHNDNHDENCNNNNNNNNLDIEWQQRQNDKIIMDWSNATTTIFQKIKMFFYRKRRLFVIITLILFITTVTTFGYNYFHPQETSNSNLDIIICHYCDSTNPQTAMEILQDNSESSTQLTIPTQQQKSKFNTLKWDENNQAVLEFCQDNNNNGDNNTAPIFGYRLLHSTVPCGEEIMIIRMKPGIHYTLTLYNNSTTSSTNIHTHGLYISGTGNADDIVRTVAPGACLEYHYDIPSFHMGGTNWFHSHMFHNSNTQVNGGAYGVLIIEDHVDTLLKNIESKHPQEPIRQWLSNEILLVFTMRGIKNNIKQVNGIKVSNDNNNNSSSSSKPFQLSMQAGIWYHVRMLFVHSNAKRQLLQFGNDDNDEMIMIKNDKACQVHVVAVDGVWTFTVPQPADTIYHPTGASRIDFAIQCHHDSTIRYGKKQSKLQDMVQINVVQQQIENDLFNVIASPFVQDYNDNTENDTTTTTTTTQQLQPWKPYRPFYLRDLSPTLKNNDSLLFTNDENIISVPQRQQRQIILQNRSINGIQYNETIPFDSFDYNTIQEWKLIGTKSHPFHMHVFHLQVFNCTGYINGEYYDTISATTNNNECLVRFHIYHYTKHIVIHCHNINHEDHGMMTWYNVNDPIPSLMITNNNNNEETHNNDTEIITNNNDLQSSVIEQSFYHRESYQCQI